MKPSVQWRTSHERAVKLKRDQVSCEWEHITGCGGPLHVAHINGNEMDNSVDNLLKLCNSHHFLLDRGRIDPSDPIMPKFRVGSDGKRRYQY